MEQRYAQSPQEVKGLNTEQLRENFLIEKVMRPNEITFVYSHYDRAIVGGAMPTNKELKLETDEKLRADFFLQRREMGVINVGGGGVITVDNTTYNTEKLDALYLGRGSQNVIFKSINPSEPALFFIYSVPAHKEFPTTLIKKENAIPTTIGSVNTANERTIYKYIHLEGAKSCQLVMGLTVLKQGCIWNTMPTHTHDRRMESYFYFDIPDNNMVVHLMGQPQETRHLIVQNNQAIISPPWSIHSGSGTSNYGFIWAMCGENLVYSDMDAVAIKDLR